MTRFFSATALIFSILITFVSLGAQASNETPFQYSPENEGAIRLIAGAYNEHLNELHAGLHIKFTNNWKTYWKHPGDTGMQMSVNSERSKNVKNLKLLWPSPKRFDYYGIETWGYKHEVVIPIKFEAVDETKPVYLGLDVKWAICDEICIFENDALSLLLKPNSESEENLGLINEYSKQVPVNIEENDSVSLSEFSVGKVIKFHFKSLNEPFYEGVDLFIYEESENFKFLKPKIKFSGDKKEVEIEVGYESLLDGVDIYKTKLEFTLANKSNSVQSLLDVKQPTEYGDKAGIVTTAKSKVSEPAEQINALEEVNSAEGTSPENLLLISIIFAFLGGLILNIMPCVLPVLSIKVMSLIKHGESDKAYIRKSFSATILGVMFSFMVLAGAVVLLKYFGHAISWGMQFQQPEFLIFLSLVITLFACNQFGFFEISLPSLFGDKIDKKIDSAGGSASLSGNFLTGAFATLMATPCTAPFLSTAIAFSLGAGIKYIFLVFFFMGVGLAFPYILILISPALVKIFPKPGTWMGKVKFVLGLLLIITSLWLVYVMASNAGLYSSVILFACLLSLFIFLKLAHKYNADAKKTFLTVIYISIVTFAIPLYFANVEMDAKGMGGKWIPFEDGVIEKYIQQGDVVFVDVTADWCLTCQFNKARVTSQVIGFFEDNNVKLIKADYTKPSKLINKYLEDNNAYAIPFNKVYGPKSMDGIKLPSILTKDSVINAVNSAK